MKTKKIKNILINHVMKNGNKKTCETLILKSMKKIQKSCKKPYKTILKISVINSTSTFRIVKLQRKKSKKISKEVPKFISNSYKRISWALKFLVNYKHKKQFYDSLKQGILINSKNEENINKIDIHKQTVLQKRLFLYFRW